MGQVTIASTFLTHDSSPAIRCSRFRVVGLARRGLMPGIGSRILVIGTCSVGTKAMLGRLQKLGWGSRIVETLREARDLLQTFKFDLVLAPELLPSGRCYDVSNSVARQLGTLLVGVPLSETSLWLPVVERGERVLGQRSLTPSMLESEAQELLGGHRTQALRKIAALFQWKASA